MELAPRYNFKETEEKWLKVWEKQNIFHADAISKKPSFTIVIPPPNVTGILHMGHALNNTLQDILIRYKRMKGCEALWMPGTDHAGIATQNVVEKQLAKEGKSRHDLGREEFLKRLWGWKQEYGDTIIHQLEKLGSSCDWSRTRFTMDDAYSDAVKEVFIRLYEKDLIYRGERIINWCPRCQTALSDEEAEHKEKNGKLYHIKYSFKNNPEQFVVVATTRPETMLGDTAVAVNPSDERYKGTNGQKLILPILGREIPIINDEYVASEFGTGAVKVTPAHDPNDFAMGQRHKLPMINVMHPDGKINEQGGPFNGLDRFDARKKLVAQLEEQGYLVKIEDHKHAVGHCYRCDTVVEPYLSKQWFVKMAPLSKPALEAVKNGTIKIRPERWEKFYINWMEGIRDWCISRQIWWGHRIPVWYDTEDNVFVARNEADAKKQARAKHGKDIALTQDPDVLDTWFSSWLWPFATLGWPKTTDDLKKFYPTNTLFTASEIIFFWVARMIMAGYEFMGKAPFTEVYIHGTVRDAKGRKMSKSLGNAIDPLEIIEEYGADALRFSLIINSGQDIFIAKDKFEIGRNFANKIWNASRLVFTNSEAALPLAETAPDPRNLDLPSKWILARFYQTLKQVEVAIETFRYSEAENLIYDFFWGDYCDWYLELTKGKFGDPHISHTLVFVLNNSLKMMHPFIPFVTEEIYSYIHKDSKPLSITAWPAMEAKLMDNTSQTSMQKVVDVISTIRTIRTQWKIKPNDAVDAVLVPLTETDRQLLEDYRQDIIRLAKLKELTIDIKTTTVKDSATGLAAQMKVFIPLSGMVDLAAEKRRMLSEVENKQKAIDSLKSRLTNETFVSKAPAEVIEKERERLASLNQDIQQLNSVLAGLSA